MTIGRTRTARQLFDTNGLSGDELLSIDPFDAESEDRWHDMEPTPFIAVVEAKSESDACEIAGILRRYDPRCLFAIQVQGGTK